MTLMIVYLPSFSNGILCGVLSNLVGRSILEGLFCFHFFEAS